MNVKPLVLPPVQDVIARCEECGKLQQRAERASDEWTFPVRCPLCIDPREENFATAITSLVPVAVSKSADGRAWNARALTPSEIARIRVSSAWIALAYCPACAQLQEGHEERLIGRFSETHFAAACATCGGATDAIALEPATISRSFEGDEWYVVVLEQDEVEHARAGGNPYVDES